MILGAVLSSYHDDSPYWFDVDMVIAMMRMVMMMVVVVVMVMMR